MAFAYVGVHVKYFTCEISKAQNVVTLCGINRNLAIFENITQLEFDNTITVHEEDSGRRDAHKTHNPVQNRVECRKEASWLPATPGMYRHRSACLHNYEE